MKIKYCIIIVLLVFLLISILVSCPAAIEEIRYAREDREKWEPLREKRRQAELYFDEQTEYCKEHEDLYMEISEQIFGYLDEGLSKEEARVTMENNATMEQKEILEKHLLYYPSSKDDFNSVGLVGNGLYYGGGDVKIVYLHKHSEELEEKMMSMQYTTTEKINDHLYVCYTAYPYD